MSPERGRTGLSRGEELEGRWGRGGRSDLRRSGELGRGWEVCPPLMAVEGGS